MKAVCVSKRGEPDVLVVKEVDRPTPQAGELLVEVEAAGVNFADVMQHRGTYPLRLPTPYVAGMEAVGVVAATGPDCSRFAVGDRVAALSFGGGGYAEYMVVTEDMALPVPTDRSAGELLALIIQGITAHALLGYSAGRVKEKTVLIHAAAGGVGLLATQLARQMDASRIIGIVGDDAKKAAVVEAGADMVFNRRTEDWAQRIIELDTKADVILDPVGEGIIGANLSVLAEEGCIISYGWLSGACPTVTADQAQAMLFANQTFTGFALDVLIRRHPMYVARAWDELIEALTVGRLSPTAVMRNGLARAREAHEVMASGSHEGKLCIRIK